MKRAFFDPSTPKVLLRWGAVRPVSWDESREYIAKGARWMPLAHAPFEKTERGTKHVEVRDAKPWMQKFQAGTLVVLGRGRCGRRLLAIIAERREYPDLASVPQDWIRGADLDPEVTA